MKSRLIFSLSVALIFLSASVLSYSQDKPTTTEKKTRQTQEKQITHTTKPNQMKTVSTKTGKVKTTQKKMTEKQTKVKGQNITKNETSKTVNTKEPKHHKEMEKKVQKKESDTPQKK